jgi:integrase
MSDLNISQGFDRNIDYETIKDKFINEFNKLIDFLDQASDYEQKISKNKLIYLIISMIQLRNGCRISEACSAFRIFFYKNNFNEKVIVKIAKSEGLKYNRAKKKKIQTKARFRKIMFPKWINTDVFIKLKESHNSFIEDERLRKRVLDYLLINFECNTHSLRYAYINYMITKKNIPLNIVAKSVGHASINQLVTYTQNKQTDALFDIDM